MNALEIQGLTKAYPTFRLENLDLTVPAGSIMGLIGENGAGKTTTIKLILNQIKKESGSIRIFGMDTVANEKEAKEVIAVALDECRFPEMLTLKNIDKIMKPIFQQWDSALYSSYLKKLGLPLKGTVKTLSKGNKMKLSIAVALSHHPKLLLLDEATSGLDPVMRSEILDILLEFIQDEEHAVLLSSHITSDLEKIADYITFIHKGKIVLSQTKDELLYQYGIAKCTTEQFRTLDRTEFVKERSFQLSHQLLVQNKTVFAQKHPSIVMDDVHLEDLMLFYVEQEEGETSWAD